MKPSIRGWLLTAVVVANIRSERGETVDESGPLFRFLCVDNRLALLVHLFLVVVGVLLENITKQVKRRRWLCSIRQPVHQKSSMKAPNTRAFIPKSSRQCLQRREYP